MLNYDTAFGVVMSSIQLAGTVKPPSGSHSLSELGFVDEEALRPVVGHIADRVGEFGQRIDTYILTSAVVPSLTVNQLVNHVMQLASGKLCSNPTNPHDQTCCPYPASCPDCGYDVK